jgi:hypothetical protein
VLQDQEVVEAESVRRRPQAEQRLAEALQLARSAAALQPDPSGVEHPVPTATRARVTQQIIPVETPLLEASSAAIPELETLLRTTPEELRRRHR